MTTAVENDDIENKPVVPGDDVGAPVVIESKEPATPAIDAAAKAAAEAAAGKQAPTDEPPVIEYVETGDPGLDLALEFVGRMGIDDQHPAMKAAIEGNFDLIEATLGAMGTKAKGFERFIALARQSFDNDVKAKAAGTAAIATAVHAAVGGAENWNAIREWAKGEATPKEVADINAALTGTPFQARAAATLLREQYERKGHKPAANAAKQDASGKPLPAANGTLNKREFAAEAQKLANKFGSHDLHKQPEYQALAKRLR